MVPTLTSKDFFPQLIAGPFHHGLVIVFSVAVVMSLIGAVASLLRGGRYVHEELEPAAADDVVVDDQPTPIRMRGWADGSSHDKSETSVAWGIETQPAVGPPSVTWRKNALPAPARAGNLL